MPPIEVTLVGTDAVNGFVSEAPLQGDSLVPVPQLQVRVLPAFPCVSNPLFGKYRLGWTVVSQAVSAFPEQLPEAHIAVPGWQYPLELCGATNTTTHDAAPPRLPDPEMVICMEIVPEVGVLLHPIPNSPSKYIEPKEPTS